MEEEGEGMDHVSDGCQLLPCPALEDNYFANKLYQREKTLALDLGATVFSDEEEKNDQPSTLSQGWCSTWGAGHFSTFDKYLYDFSGTCNYIFAASPPDFDIQLRRADGRHISRIIIEVGPSLITVENSVISIKDCGVVSLPYTFNGIQIMPFGQNVRLVAKLLEMELVVMWNNDDYLMVMVEKKYMKKTFGLCGNFDEEESNELQSEAPIDHSLPMAPTTKCTGADMPLPPAQALFLFHSVSFQLNSDSPSRGGFLGKLLDLYRYAAQQKMDDPTHICAYEELPVAKKRSRNHIQLCLQLLTQVGPNCNVSKYDFAARCQLDLEACPEPVQPNCSCPTLSEYSRQCSMSGQPVTNWRRPSLCSEYLSNRQQQEPTQTQPGINASPTHPVPSACLRLEPPPPSPAPTPAAPGALAGRTARRPGAQDPKESFEENSLTLESGLQVPVLANLEGLCTVRPQTKPEEKLIPMDNLQDSPWLGAPGPCSKPPPGASLMGLELGVQSHLLSLSRGLGECPANQVYQECGTPCMKTCSNPAHSCPSFCTFGCFCPEGMVLDDISKNQSCVPIEQCPCTFNRVTYSPGEVMKAPCRTCQCTSGEWICTELPCPGRCSLEGGSFITTFDSRHYRFHGTCTYILVKSPSLPNNGTLMAVYDKSGYSHSETSLMGVIYSSAKDKIVISQDDLLIDDGDVKWLPYKAGDITIFRQTSTHLQMSTTFGLELVVQLRPVFQVYVKVGLQFKGNTRGLCGNYNGDTTDDFLSSMDIIEGTASLFVDSWRLGNCPSALERETDPCSMSQLNSLASQAWHPLQAPSSLWAALVTQVLSLGKILGPSLWLKDPGKPLAWRCVYQACNYEETFPYICSALGSYARMCASMGLILNDWRSTVDNCTVSCTGNQTFSYDSQACNRTCLSLADHTLECHPSDIPVDGCNCPEGTYLDHRSECVRQSRCPCFLEDRKFILADQSTIISGIPCEELSICGPVLDLVTPTVNTLVRGILYSCWLCAGGQLLVSGTDPRDRLREETYRNKNGHRGSTRGCGHGAQQGIRATALMEDSAVLAKLQIPQSSDSKYGAACAPTCQMLATGIDCVPTKCESGCVCDDGLYENLNGDCVPPDDCPCEFGGLSYNRGDQIQTKCLACTCIRGKWQCLKKDKCFSTCALYGEGHLTTFDGQHFVFDGNCEYVLTTVRQPPGGIPIPRHTQTPLQEASIPAPEDGCGTNSNPTFKIVTENVICGKSGVTCSRAIKLFLGDQVLILSDASYTITGKNPQGHIQVKKNALHLMFDVTIPGKFNLTLIWNKRMSIFIKMFRDSQDPLCGLCGNYNDNMKDDFETRSKYVTSSELEFVNSWKENPLCGDISFVVDPCVQNPYRKAWAEKKCAIINSNTFSACHSKVYRMPYYDACVRDTCGCDTGGDCECMCDAVAAYAKACLDVGVCVDWRAPDFCPPYCDFFNTHKLISEDGSYQYSRESNCTWHYQPCLCPFQSQRDKHINIEGCYNCTQDQYFDHEEGQCVPCSQMLLSTPSPTTAGECSTTKSPGDSGPFSARPHAGEVSTGLEHTEAAPAPPD
ncbi:mucin-6 [Notamacropus eugenii]|uniref:mucin-6 n=1 Tax=Notamacropus eugenii TaxID=9315 RepID=UPI003B684543